MRDINRKYRNVDRSTDVLSFSYAGEKQDDLPLLGEIVIDPGTAATQARRYGVSPEREVRQLLLHGILHLLGYDHETDDGEMMNAQKRLMRSQSFRTADPTMELRSRR
jgi:probable rRNA maturation factor